MNESNFLNISKDDGDIFYLETKGNFYQSAMFYRNVEDDLKRILFKTNPIKTKTIDMIDASESVAIHIRRGDFFNMGWALSITFQKQAIQIMRNKLSKPHFFVFSDDTDFINKAFVNENDVTIAATKFSILTPFLDKAINDMQMMTRCKHMIVSNSTFAWWAAYLIPNPKKVVIAPSRPIHNNSEEYYPSSWIKIEAN